MMKKRLLSMLLAAAMVLGMVGCSSGEETSAEAEPAAEETEAETETEEPAADGEKKVIGMAMINFVNPFYISQMEVAQEYADANGWELICKSAEGSLESQVAIVENFIEQGVDGILVDAVDAEGVKDVMKKSTDAGVPIMSLNNPIDAGGNYSCSYEHYIGFKGVTTAVAEKLGGEGKVCLIQGGIGNFAGDERTRGFEEALENYPGIEVLDMQPCDWDPSKAVEILQNWLTAYDDIDAVLCQTDGATASLVEVIESAGKDIYVAGNDGELDVLQLMTEDRVLSDTLLGSKRGAWLAMLTMNKILSGEEVENTVYVPSYLVVDEELQAQMEENGVDLSWIKVCTAEEAIEISDAYVEEFKDYE